MALVDPAQMELLKPKKKPKYHNKPSRDGDGVYFASQKERDRWEWLKLGQKLGALKDLKRQVRFKLSIENILICTYVADFTYYKKINENGFSEYVVEDTKGFHTKEYEIKKRLMLALRGIEIKET